MGGVRAAAMAEGLVEEGMEAVERVAVETVVVGKVASRAVAGLAAADLVAGAMAEETKAAATGEGAMVAAKEAVARVATKEASWVEVRQAVGETAG